MAKRIQWWPAMVVLFMAVGFGAFAEGRGGNGKAGSGCGEDMAAAREVPQWVYDAVWYKGRLFRDERAAHRWRQQNRERNGAER